MVDANVYQVGAFTPKMTARLEKRGKRSGVIVVSSIGAQLPIPGNYTYCATKVFVKYLFQVLSNESGDKVDVLALQPGFVETKMIADAKK